MRDRKIATGVIVVVCGSGFASALSPAAEAVLSTVYAWALPVLAVVLVILAVRS